MEKQEIYYTPKELAQMWKCSNVAIYEWVRKGTLKGIRLGKLVRISEKEVKAFPFRESLKK